MSLTPLPSPSRNGDSPGKAPLQLWGGVECTVNRVGDTFHSQLRRTGHWRRLDDLDRIAELGIRTLRYPVLWEEIAPNDAAEHDWSWPDQRLGRLRELGIEPIVGLVHHGSGPRYTSLIDPAFPEKLAAYARAVAERYPSVTDYTPVNEPLTTARFSGLYGHWYPHGKDALTFGRALLLQLRGVVLAMRAIRQVNPAARLIQTEDLGVTFSSPALAYQAAFENERRWLTWDILSGRMTPGHPVWSYMRWAGITEAELSFFAESPCPPDVIGINHYVTSNRFLDEDLGRYPPDRCGGNERDAYADFEAVRVCEEATPAPEVWIEAACRRYGLPVAVTEAHLACTREEQLRWFTEIWNAARTLRERGAEVIAVTAWSLFGSYDWCSLLTEPRGILETGAWDLRSPEPRPTAMAALLQRIASGDEPQHPVLSEPGWWHRRIRLLPCVDPEANAGREQLRKAFTPLGNSSIDGRHTAERRTILIAGATGRLGQTFARICYLRGLSYRLLTRAEMDIANPGKVEAALDAFRPWAVINAVGYSRVDDAEHNRARCFRENSLGAEVLAQACGRHAVRLATFSSDLVFSGKRRGPYVEADPVAPLNAFGRSKAAAEKRVLAACPEALVIRSGPGFGPWDRENFVLQAIAALSCGQRFRAASDVQVSPTYRPDLAHATLDLLLDGESGIWHLANHAALSWAGIARLAAEATGLDVDLIEPLPGAALELKARRPPQSALISERGRLLPDFGDALARFLREGDVNAFSAAASGRAESV